MENKIGSVLLWLVYLFRVFGFCPISINPRREQHCLLSKLLFMWSILVLTAYNMIIFTVYRNYCMFLYTEERFALFNDTLKVSITFISFNVSALQSLISRTHERNFWCLYIKLRSERRPLMENMKCWEHLCEHLAFLSKFGGIMLINVVFHIGFALSYSNMPFQLMMFWIMYTPYTLVHGIRNAQFVMYMDLIRLEIKHLQKDLDILVEFADYHLTYKTFPQFETFVRRRLIGKQRIYEMIFDMNNSFQNACNWAMVFHLLRLYTRMLVDGYYCFWSVISTGFLLKDVLLIPAVLEIPMFLLTAKSCMTATRFISYRVHNLKHSSDNIATSVQIQNFSLQLLHQQIKIDGLGIASMDGYMLTKAIGSITTYMVFFIQFMPKFKSKFD